MTIAALVYHVHDGCPPAAVFVEQVRARTAAVEFGDGHAIATVAVGVEITREQDRSVGKLTIVSPDAPRTERDLSSATCSELVRALALSAAMNLDPSLADEGQPAPAPQPAVLPKASDPSKAFTPNESPTSSEDHGVPSLEPDHPSATSLGASMGADVFFGEAASPGLTLYVDHVFGGRTQPSWRAGLHGSRAMMTSEQGSITLYWITARVSGSPIRLHLGAIELVPNALVDAGALVGHGSPTSNFLPGENAATSWVAAGLGGRLEVRLSRNWVAELEAAGLLPLFGRAAGFDGPSAIFETPRVALSAGAGARYDFP